MSSNNIIHITRKLPVNLADNDSYLFENAFKLSIAEPIVSRNRKVRISGKSIIFKGFKILTESFVTERERKKFGTLSSKITFFSKHYLFRKSFKVKATCIWFTDSWSREYFHWLTDALPRLLLVKDYIHSSVVILPEDYRKIDYIQQSLKVFGVKQVQYVPDRSVAEVNELILPSHTAPTGNYNENLIRKLSDLFIGFLESNVKKTYGERIYISRGKSARRKIVNESEVIDLLKEYGYSILCFEDFDFEEQISIMIGTRFLISNHGAGLTNMLFMKSGASVLELRREGDSHNNCYYSLSSALNHKYYYQCCKPEGNNEDTFTANLLVDIDKLRKNLDWMLKNVF